MSQLLKLRERMRAQAAGRAVPEKTLGARW